MKRGLKRSLVRPAAQQEQMTCEQSTESETQAPETASTAFRRAASGAGSAWKAGAVAQTQANLDEARDGLSVSIKSGNHVLSVDPTQIKDLIGSDRRNDWKDQPEFRSLVDSIRINGQDTPVVIWPASPDWEPDSLDPENISGVEFLLLAGRRRHAAALELGLPVRAVMAVPSAIHGESVTFQMLVLRFRENEAREDLGAFERLLSIGEMFEALKQEQAGGKLSAVAFAARVGVHESVVSRARKVFRSKDHILHACKNAYDMSFRELEDTVAGLGAEKNPKPEKTAVNKIAVSRKIGSQNLSVTSHRGRLSVSAAGLNLDKAALEGLSDVIAAYLEQRKSKD